MALLPEASLRAAVLVAYRSRGAVAELLSPEDEEARSRVDVRIGVASFDGAAREIPQDWQNVVLRAEYSLFGPRGETGQPTPG